MKYVVDASVAIKWFFEEDSNLEADRFIDENIILCAPDFILLETASILWKKRRRGEINSQDDALIFFIFRDAIKELAPISPLAEQTLQLSKELDHSVYDCAYLVVALLKQMPLVTADRKFYSKVKASGYASQIVWIEEPPQTP